MSGAVKLEEVVVDVQKNARERLRLRLTAFRGVRCADLRVWYSTLQNGKEVFKPAKQGVAIRPSLLPEIIEGLRRIAESERIEAEDDAATD